MKKYWISHIAIGSFYVCECLILSLTICVTISEQVDLARGIVPDYVLGFNTYLLINHFILLFLLGLAEIILFIIFLFVRLIFRKSFLVNEPFLTTNFIYHIFWTLGFYVTFIITFCVFIYLITITHEGIVWIVDQWR